MMLNLPNSDVYSHKLMMLPKITIYIALFHLSSLDIGKFKHTLVSKLGKESKNFAKRIANTNLCATQH